MNSIKKWDDILEELLQCCVCLELPNSTILQCERGHHICHFCRRKLQHCPVCKQFFIETRNLLAEDLISRFKDIKLAIAKEIMEQLEELKCEQQLANMSVQTEVVLKTSSTTQTDKMACTDNEQKSNNTPRQIVFYPCFGSCTLILSYRKLMDHLKQHHKDTFYEVYQNQKIFSDNFEINTENLPRNYDHVFSITNMGLFYVKIIIHNNGQLLANLQIVDKNVETIIFEYRIVVANSEHTIRRRGMVTSCLTDERVSHWNSVYISQKEMSRILQEKSSCCTIIIKRCKHPVRISDTKLIK